MELTLDQALQKGVEAHKAGKAEEADRYYTAILKASPKHSDANHNMGVLAVEVGKVQQALPFFKTALEANAGIAQYWLSFIDALIKLDRMADAKAVFAQAKSNGAKGDGFDQIEQKLTQPNILDELKLDKAIKLAKKKIKDGLREQAKKIYEDILEKFPKNKKALYGIKTLAGKTVANTSDPKVLPSDQLQNLIKLYFEGQFQEALSDCTKLLIKYPSSVELYNIIGAAHKGLGNFGEALEAYSKALSIKPDYADTYNNIGVALKDEGKSEEAIEAYKKAISIKPDYAEAYNNLGVTLQDQGKLDEAIDAYNRALSIKPNHTEANYNLGNALKGIVFHKPNRDLQNTIVCLIDGQRYVKPNDIFDAAISLLKFEPALKKHLKLVNSAIVERPLDVISDLSELTLLLKLMSVCPLPDLELEKLLKKLRRAILFCMLSLKEASPQLLDFQSALALQCFTNEYIYSQTDEEEKTLKSLDAHVRKYLENNDQPSPQIILTLASYKALNQYDWCNLLAVTDEIKDVFIRQVEEPNQEEKLKQDLPILEEISDSISSKVREQYEESPYPRWVNLGLSLKPLSILNAVDEIKLKLHDNKITEVEKPEILIAGCGTGQHSIGTATRYKNSQVLAIDLSLSSLAYAKRKTDELGIENIKYMQADILDLAKLNKDFDIIESAGVLHHMDNPMTGWRVLSGCLKLGGLMKIGLYSELARQDIVKIRDEIRQAGVGLSSIEMRSFRDEISQSKKQHHKSVLRFRDYYNLSELKDLIFHVQEHRFTIPQIKDHLDELGLEFCGFEVDHILSHFKQTNTNKCDLFDLGKWQSYEETNPNVFAGMYQFWCQKVE